MKGDWCVSHTNCVQTVYIIPESTYTALYAGRFHKKISIRIHSQHEDSRERVQQMKYSHINHC